MVMHDPEPLPDPEPHLRTLPRLAALPLRRGHVADARPTPAWGLAELAGRLVELSGPGDSAALTLAFGLVLDAQRRDEPAAWITVPQHAFFPPDVAAGGVDLDALLVVRVPDAVAAGRAADRLVRSGAFGLVVLDLGADARLPAPLVARLSGLAQKYHAAIVFLTQGHGTLGRGVQGHGILDRGPRGRGTRSHETRDGGARGDGGAEGASSLGSLISLRAAVQRVKVGADRFRCELRVIKDKRRGPTWRHAEVCCGPPGLH